MMGPKQGRSSCWLHQGCDWRILILNLMALEGANVGWSKNDSISSCVCRIGDCKRVQIGPSRGHAT